ncbi:MAG: hypothetical protein L7H18_02905 [Candidatus Nealsonbacteria bacterium DGGOD1a]|nr:MAG: hypothetical protein L7H18_02905 [Candidatus Nealsonbacteria bacterium DGGOD1a]
MTIDDLKKLAREIIAEAQRLKIAHTSEDKAPVNYACAFARRVAEYEEMVDLARQLGPIARNTAMGPVFHIDPLPTVAGSLELLKIRRPDTKRRERGDADFTVANYENFKKKYLGKPEFGIIKRPEMEMVELIDPTYDALAYFSHPTLVEVIRINLDKKIAETVETD